MRTRTWVGLGCGALAAIAAGALLGACGGASGDGFGSGTGGSGQSAATTGTGAPGSWGTGSNAGAGGGAVGATGGWGTSTAGSGVTASGGWSGEEPPPTGTNTQDAGTAPPFTCTGLDQSKPVVLYLSADDSNSMASPVIARELLSQGSAPRAGQIRTYEFLNYYRIAYPAAPAGSLSILPQMEPAETAGNFNLQIAVRSFDAVKPRRSITVTFVLDTSGSMGGPAIERERAAVKAIVSSLGTGDIVNMVTWNTTNSVLLNGYAVSGPNDAKLLKIADELSANGGTDLHGGLEAGYKLAQANYGAGRLNRLVLVSDGGANVGITDEQIIAKNSADNDKEGIYLVGVGAGPAVGYSDLLMDTVTDKGRGAYVYLDQPAEAKRMFADRFDETMEVAARGVQVEMTLPWYFKMEKFYGEEYSTNAAEIEPQHLAPNDAMIFNQVVRACDVAIVQDNDVVKVKAKWVTPITYAPHEVETTISVHDLLTVDRAQLTKGKAIVAYAEALKEPTAQSLKAAHAMAVAANATGSDVELKEIAGLIEKHPAYTP